MNVLGHAIARHLARLDGLYSVELPESLTQEMHGLVVTANAVAVNRAILVTDDTVPANVSSTRWRDVLGWRTSDNRIFAWKRGSREPDTSFRSVVRPFISSRFPGAGGGECTLTQLVKLCIAELWHRRGRQPVGDSFDAFVNTAQWVAGLLHHVFETSGSTPSVHWSDRFLEHWAGMLTASMRILRRSPSHRSRDTPGKWRSISGMPLPARIAEGNPFLAAPKELEQKDWASVAKTWDDIVQSFVLVEGGVSVLLVPCDQDADRENNVCRFQANLKCDGLSPPRFAGCSVSFYVGSKHMDAASRGGNAAGVCTNSSCLKYCYSGQGRRSLPRFSQAFCAATVRGRRLH